MSNRYPKWSVEEIKNHVINSPVGALIHFNYVENIANVVKWRDRRNLRDIVSFVNRVNKKGNDFYLSGMVVMGCLTENPKRYSDLSVKSVFSYERERDAILNSMRVKEGMVSQDSLSPFLRIHGRDFFVDSSNCSPEGYSGFKLIRVQSGFNLLKESPIEIGLYLQGEFDGKYSIA